MNIIWTVLIGLGAGLTDWALARRRDPDGIVNSAAIGIGGAVLAFHAGDLAGWNRAGASVGAIGAALGAVILLAIYRLARSKPS